jgi:hypothetical protein
MISSVFAWQVVPLPTVSGQSFTQEVEPPNQLLSKPSLHQCVRFYDISYFNNQKVYIFLLGKTVT